MKALLTATLTLLFSSAALCQSARDVTASLPTSFTNILKEREYTGSSSISEWQFQKLNNNTNARPFFADGQVDSGDDVSVSFSGFYADADGNPSSNVATTTQLLLSLSLSGDDADKYHLTNPSVSIPSSFTPQDLKSSDQPEAVAFRNAFENFKLIDSEINVSTKIIESSLGYYPLRSDSVAIYQSHEGFTVYATKGIISKPTIVGSGREIILVLTLVGNDNYKLSVSQLSYCSNCGSVILPYYDIYVSPDTIVDYGTTISVAVKGSNSYAISGYINYDPQTGTGTGLIKAQQKAPLPVGTHVVTGVATGSGHSKTVKSFNVTVLPISLSINGQPSIASRPYDTTANLGKVTLPTLDGSNLIKSDTASLFFSVDSSAVRPSVGTYQVLFLAHLSNPNYSLSDSVFSVPFTITPSEASSVSLSGNELPSTSKVYDGTTDLPLTSDSIPIPNTHAHITAARFSSPKAGSQSIVVDIAADANYTLQGGVSSLSNVPYPTKGTITQRPVSPKADAVVASRVYDATTAIERRSVTPPTLNNVVPTDSVSAMVVSAEADNPAPGLRVATISLALVGPDAANYTLGDNTSVTAPVTITQLDKTPVRFALRGSRPLTYGNSTIGAIPDADIFVDTDPIVNGSLSVNSHDSGIALPAGDNLVHLVFTPQDTILYAIADSTISISVNPVTLSLVGSFSANGKVYDGTSSVTDSSFVLPSISGVLDDDDVRLNVDSVSFASKNAGDNAITAYLSLTGSDANNYSLPTTSLSCQASISPKQLSVTTPQFSSTSKIYDGTSSAPDFSTPPSLIGVVDGDDVSLSYSAAFDSPDTGSRTITTTLSLTGSDANNYTLPTSALSCQATISPKQLSVTTPQFSSTSKVYDGTSSAPDFSTPPTLIGVVDGDDVSLSSSAAFDSPDAGSHTITTSLSLTGSDANNYSLPTTSLSCQASISPKQLSVTTPLFSSTSKSYDGTTSAPDFSTLPSLIGVVDGDDVSLSSSAAFDSPDAGQRTIVVSFSLLGSDANNYLAPDAYSVAGEITKPSPTPDPEPDPTPVPDPIAATATILSAADYGYCATDTIVIALNVSSGTPTSYSLTFSDALFPNVIEAAIPDDFVLHIPVPSSDYFGSTNASLVLHDANNNVSSSAVNLTLIRRPDASRLGVKFGNTLFVNNFDNAFSAYQWTADGIDIPGASNQFFFSPTLSPAVYACRLTTSSGDVLLSCPLTINSPSSSTTLSVAPNPVRTGESLSIRFGNADATLSVELYNTFGALCESHSIPNGGSFPVSSPQGAYVVSVSSSNATAKVKITIK